MKTLKINKNNNSQKNLNVAAILEMAAKSFGDDDFTEEEKELIENALKKRLGRNYLSTRPAGGGQSVVYIEGWKVIQIA